MPRQKSKRTSTNELDLVRYCSSVPQRSTLISAIAAYVSEPGDPEDFALNATRIYSGEGGADSEDVALADPAAQAIFEFGGDSTILDNADEFGDFKAAIAKKRKRSQVLLARFRLRQERGRGGRRGGGRGRGRGRGLAAGGDLPPLDVFENDGNAEAEQPPPPQPPAPDPQNGPADLADPSFHWGGFKISHRTAIQDHRCEGWIAVCPYHRKALGKAGLLNCCREMSVGAGFGSNLNSEQVLRKLKLWCISGPQMGQDRHDHMNVRRQRSSAEDIPTNEELDNRRITDWDPLDYSGVNNI